MMPAVAVGDEKMDKDDPPDLGGLTEAYAEIARRPV